MRFRVVAAGLVVLALASCEMMFTTSPLSFLQRDPANLSPEQQVVFARDALASGNRDQMKAAYELLKGSGDPQTRLLAADLALGASGLESGLAAALPDLLAAGDDQEALDEALEEFLGGFSASELTLMSEAATLLASAADDASPTPEQYLLAAVGLMAVAADEHGGVTGLDAIGEGDPGHAEVEQAKSFLQAAYDALEAKGESTDLLEGIGDSIGWQP